MAGLLTLTRRQTAAVVSVPVVVIALGLLATMIVGYFGYRTVSGLINSAGVTNDSGATNGAHAALTHFCAKLALYNTDGAVADLSAAFADLTPAFQARIGSAANLPTKLITDAGSSQATVGYCHPADQSSSDQFYHEDGATATDKVQFEALTANGAITTISNHTMYFVKQGVNWKIDKVQRDT